MGRTDVAKLLIEHGADAGAVANDGQSALDIAQKLKQPEIAELLIGALLHAAPRPPPPWEKRWGVVGRGLFGIGGSPRVHFYDPTTRKACKTIEKYLCMSYLI